MPVRVGKQYRVQNVIDEACALGCEIRLSKAQLATPWGMRHIRFLYNPATGGRFDMTDYNNDEFMLASEVNAAERRLGIVLTLP